MIVDKILQLLVDILVAFAGLFDLVTILPWGLDNIVMTGVGLFRGFANIFPPINAIFVTFMIYFGFRLGIMLFGVVPIFGKLVNPHKKA